MGLDGVLANPRLGGESFLPERKQAAAAACRFGARGQSQLAHELQCPPPQLEHPPWVPATARPLLWAKKTESVRELCSLPQPRQAIGASAWANGRRASKRSRQSRQTYS